MQSSGSVRWEGGQHRAGANRLGVAGIWLDRNSKNGRLPGPEHLSGQQRQRSSGPGPLGVVWLWDSSQDPGSQPCEEAAST